MSGFLEDLVGDLADDRDAERALERRREERLRRIAHTGEADDQLPVVLFVAFRCPSCSSRKVQTYGRSGSTRYHRCRECETVFRSRELTHDQALDLVTPEIRTEVEAAAQVARRYR